MTFKNFLAISLVLSIGIFSTSCKKEDNGQEVIVTPDPVTTTYYFAGIEAATDPATEVLSPATSLSTGEITPINNGFEQPAWMSFMQGPDQIIVGGYTSAPEFVSYEVKDRSLTKGSSFFTDLGIYAHDFVDTANMIMVGSPREGLAIKKIYHINTDDMAIVNTVESDFGNIIAEADSTLGFPVDAKVRDGKLFIAYYNLKTTGDFTTPHSNEARVAVFDYPSLSFDKIITDSRTANLGRYYSHNTLEIDENGNIYTFAPSSLACGYAPVPANNSGILRIPNGSTEFDPNYFIDFEAISGGYKINDFYYVKDNKAVVRFLQEDETNPDYLWATYAPTSSLPLMGVGILDLVTSEFTPLPNVPASGGGWNSAVLVEGSKLYLGVSNSSYAGIYVVDVDAKTATAGATIDGNYAKGVLSLTETK